MADRKPQQLPGIPGIPGILSIESVPNVTPVAPVAPIAPPATSVPGTRSARGRVAGIAVGVYWIDKYKINACIQNSIDHGQRIAQGFASTMSSLGHSVAFARGNRDASPSHWHFKGDRSQFGIDTVEFAYLATHGSTHGKERPNGWLYFWLGTFDSPDGCRIATIDVKWVPNPRDPDGGHWEPINVAAPSVVMQMGETRLRWVVLDTCNSMQIGVENLRPVKDYITAAESLEQKYHLRASNPALTWSRCCDGVNMIFGFTGLSSDDEGTSLRGASFARRAGRGEALGDAWLDEAYSWRLNDVPVAFAVGTSEDDARKRVNGETVKGPARSLRNAQIGGFAWIWRS